MHGIILAGGSGSRLRPSTLVVNKHLLPVYDKPMIYYPLTTLLLSGVDSITIVVNGSDLSSFTSLLGDGKELGIGIDYVVQSEPRGLADGFLTAASQTPSDKYVMILGDNIFHGKGLGRQLSESEFQSGAMIFGYQVADPTPYGVIEFDEGGRVISITEKPINPKSNIVVTGLYLLDNTAVSKSENLRVSKRGEFEITDVLSMYLESTDLQVNVLPRGTAWIDAGTHETLSEASNFVKIIQDRTGMKVGDPLEAARYMGRI